MTTHRKTVKVGGIDITVEQADFTSQKCGVMVVSVSHDLRHEGAAAKAVEKAAGESYKHLIKNAAPGHALRNGEIVSVFVDDTTLSASYVILVVSPDKLHLSMAYINILNKSIELNVESVVIPGLGCGGLNVPPDYTAKKFATVLTSFVQQKKSFGSLKHVRIVDRDYTVYKSFVRALRNEFPDQFANDPVDAEATASNEDSIFVRCTRVPLANEVREEDPCAICLDELGNDPIHCRAIKKCSHVFHAACFKSYLDQSQPRCPYCNEYFSAPCGNQPNGTMQHHIRRGGVPGFNVDHFIEIEYIMEDGIQGPQHLRPGVPFYGTRRVAYLPDNPEGRKVLELLRLAFQHKLIFTVGDSVTTGARNVVVWNNIHHKTSLHGGSAHFGYPDETYLARVTAELAGQGITEDLLNTQ